MHIGPWLWFSLGTGVGRDPSRIFFPFDLDRIDGSRYAVIRLHKWRPVRESTARMYQTTGSCPCACITLSLFVYPGSRWPSLARQAATRWEHEVWCKSSARRRESRPRGGNLEFPVLEWARIVMRTWRSGVPASRHNS